MTVSNTNTKDKFTTNGVTVDFPFTFYLTNTQQVFAKLVDAQGDETDYTNFTVIKNPDNNGGTLTTNDVLDNTDLLIFRDTQQTQETDYIPGGRFPAESHEQALDKLTLINQEQQEELDRSLKSKISDEAPPVFNPEGEGILQLENGEVGVSVLTVDEAISISENAQFFEEIAESPQDTATSPGGVTQTTITGLATLASEQRDEFDQLAEEQRDQFDATFTAQFTYKRIGNISLYVGDSLPEVDKLNSYQYPDDSGEWYGPIQDQAFPITIPADPSSDNGWALVNALTVDSLPNYTNLAFDSVADAIAEVSSNDYPIGTKLTVDDYYGGANHNNSGVLFFKVVAPGTGVSDGGKYIDAGPLQLEQLMKNLYTLESYGVGATLSESENAERFINAIKYNGIAKTNGKYSFDFSLIGEEVVSHESLFIDLGLNSHEFKEFSGFSCPITTNAYVNVVLDASQTQLIKFLEFDVVKTITGDTIDVSNVKMQTDQNCFFINVNENNDISASIDISNARFKNWIAKVTDGVSPYASSMTLFGQFNSSSTFTERHDWNFGTLYIDEWYTVRSSDEQIVDGESDCLRMFSAPSSVNIGVLTVNNFAKRFFKGQDESTLNVGIFNTYLDSRFSGSSNHISTVDFQVVNQITPSKLSIDVLNIDYGEHSGNEPLFFSGSGTLNHLLSVDSGEFDTFAVFSASAPMRLDIRNFYGSGMFLNVEQSDFVKLTNYRDSDIKSIRCSRLKIEQAVIRSTAGVNTTNILPECRLENVTFDDWNIGNKIGLVKYMSDVTFNFTQGSVDNRPINVPEGVNYYTDINVNNVTGNPCILMTRTFGAGKVNVTNADLGVNMSLAFMTGGVWDFVLNNSDNEVITGNGVNSKVKANYTPI